MGQAIELSNFEYVTENQTTLSTTGLCSVGSLECGPKCYGSTDSN